jgi:protein required for attachment to host cells
MTRRWIVVADSSQARIYRVERHGPRLIAEHEHAASAEHNRDLMGNRPHLNQHPMEKDLKGDESASLRDDESRKFARRLGGLLATSHARNEFRELVLVADPRFLGMLRGALKRPVSAAVVQTIDKRALQSSAEELAELISSPA